MNDPVFSTGTMGQGCAIIPLSNTILSPINGEVTVVYKTKHAVGLKSNDGIEMLIHIGIDTARLDGEGYSCHVTNGDHINKGDRLITFDWKLIKSRGLDPTVMIIITNSTNFSSVEVIAEGEVSPTEEILEIIN